MTAPAPFALRPAPERAGTCPSCGDALDVLRVHVAGAHPAISGRCSGCGHRVVADLTTGSAVDLATGEATGPRARSLTAAWEHGDADPVAVTVDVRRPAGDAVLVPCLHARSADDVRRALDGAGGRERLVALVPAAFAGAVPEDVAEVWSADVTPERASGWLLALDDRTARELDRLERCTLAPTPVPAGDDVRTDAPPPPAPPRPLPHRAVSVAVGLTRERLQRLRAEHHARRRRERAAAIGAPAVLADRNGHRFQLIDEPEVLAFLELGGGSEEDEVEVARAVLRPGDVAFDVGGHIGKFAVAMGAKVRPGGVVHTFEPLPRSFARLEENLALNDLADVVTTHEAAVSDAPGESVLTLYGPGYESWSSLVPRSVERPDLSVRPESTVTVRTTTVDETAVHAGVDHVNLLKIDVEGAEARVLAGAASLLGAGAVDVLLVELSDHTLGPAGTSAVEVVGGLEEQGFWPLHAEDGRLVPFRPVGHLDRLINLVAASAAGRERLREAGLLA